MVCLSCVGLDIAPTSRTSIASHGYPAPGSPYPALAFPVSCFFQEKYREVTELLYGAVDVGQMWFSDYPEHEKLALWRNKLAYSLTMQAR